MSLAAPRVTIGLEIIPSAENSGFSQGSLLVSGIYGMIRHNGEPVTVETLAPIANAMSGWGADGHGQWCGESVGLGHLMLHVTPESLHERLPASIRVAPHLVITADARIDNREEIFDALKAPGAGRSKTPDSSLILLAYERWGPDCVKRLLGDFAFAVWDARARTLFCARDPFGCKPFFYFHDRKGFTFASDIKGVLACVESPRLNESLLALHLQMNSCYAQTRLTFFQDIVKLPPAHTLTVTETGVTMSRYWSPDDAPEVRVLAGDYIAQLGLLFSQSLECRLRSAYPIGAHLSGGLDSSAITIAAARLLRGRGRPLDVFSWSPPPDVNQPLENEYARIGAVCRQEGLTCEYVPATKADFIESFRRDITVEPTVMMARENNVQLRAEKRGLRVILSGWGGDEAVTCGANPGRLNMQGGPRRFVSSLREMVAVRLPDSLYRRVVADPFMTFRAPCVQPAFAQLHEAEMKGLRIPALRRFPDIRTRISRLLGIGHLLLRAEHWAVSGAQRRLVYRYPMLDRRLIEFALGSAPTPDRESGRRRSLFRLAVDETLPAGPDWNPAKKEAATQTALHKEQMQAYLDWARHLVTNGAAAPTRFVDRATMIKAVETAAKSVQIQDLSGVREAFGCFAIQFTEAKPKARS